MLLLQFTGVGCGPCHASIPFLKQLVEDNQENNFEFISIESWNTNITGLKRYQKQNAFNFKFLISEDEVTKQYKIMGVHVFFVLDESRIIQDVVLGYKKGDTDLEIKEAIARLM